VLSDQLQKETISVQAKRRFTAKSRLVNLKNRKPKDGDVTRIFTTATQVRLFKFAISGLSVWSLYLERLKPGNVHMCPMKLTFRYNSMLNFIQVSFCFLLFLRLGLGSVIGLGFKVRVRVRDR